MFSLLSLFSFNLHQLQGLLHILQSYTSFKASYTFSDLTPASRPLTHSLILHQLQGLLHILQSYTSFKASYFTFSDLTMFDFMISVLGGNYVMFCILRPSVSSPPPHVNSFGNEV